MFGKNAIIRNVPELRLYVVFIKTHMTTCRLTNVAKALAASIFRVELPLKFSQQAHHKDVI